MAETGQPTRSELSAVKRNDVAIELVSGSVGGASQVLVGQVSLILWSRADTVAPRHFEDGEFVLHCTTLMPQ